MFFETLRRDLKRKKTMNIILLLFVILSAMFAAASVNNIVSVTGGLDYYFEKAGMGDYCIISRDDNGVNKADEVLSKSKFAKNYHAEKIIYSSSEAYKSGSEKLMSFSNISVICDIDDTHLKFFDDNNEIISDVEEGKAILTGAIPRNEGVLTGEDFTLSLGTTKLHLEVAGFAKDALLGSPMMGNPRLLLNSADFNRLCEDEQISSFSIGHIYYIESDNIEGLESELSSLNGVLFSGSKDTIKTTYLMNIIVTMIILIVSIGLIIVAFVAMRFTIKFTIAEEFREIGVMKAVGISSSQIRLLYLTKYFSLAVTGACIGYFLSIPFGQTMLKSASGDMILGNNNTTVIGIICCIAVVFIILMFGWVSTDKIKKLSPLDAIRSGQTGERFNKRGILRLKKWRLNTTGFLACNDVLSERRHYGMLTAIFAICASLVMILAVTADTLNSESILYLLSITKSDMYLSDTTLAMDVISGVKTLHETTKSLENTLDKYDMPAKVYLQGWYKLSAKAGDKSYSFSFLKCNDTKTTDYEYTAGSPPISADEVAVTEQVAKKLGIKIGDYISVDIAGEDKDFMVTAFFETMANLGEAGRFHESLYIPDNLMTSAYAYQVDFNDNPDDEVIAERIALLKDKLDNKNIFNVSEFVNDCTGVSSAIASLKNFVLLLVILIIILLTILTERSFISREKTNIALMKAIGFSDGSVIAYHVLRFSITVIIAIAMAGVLLLPLTELTINPIFHQIGATGNIEYKINYSEVYVLYPIVIFAASIIGAALTALYSKKIKPVDTASIE